MSRLFLIHAIHYNFASLSISIQLNTEVTCLFDMLETDSYVPHTHTQNWFDYYSLCLLKCKVIVLLTLLFGRNWFVRNLAFRCIKPISNGTDAQSYIWGVGNSHLQCICIIIHRAEYSHHKTPNVELLKMLWNSAPLSNEKDVIVIHFAWWKGGAPTACGVISKKPKLDATFTMILLNWMVPAKSCINPIGAQRLNGRVVWISAGGSAGNGLFPDREISELPELVVYISRFIENEYGGGVAGCDSEVSSVWVGSYFSIAFHTQILLDLQGIIQTYSWASRDPR